MILLVFGQSYSLWAIGFADPPRTISFKTTFGTKSLSYLYTNQQSTLNYWASALHPAAVTEYSYNEYSTDFSHYVDTQSVQTIAEAIASEATYGEEDVADTVLSFVQNVGYVSNAYTVQYTLYPVEILATGGVCDDLSVLYASMMISLGYQVAFLYYPHTTDLGGSQTAHVEVAVHLTSPPEHTTYGNYTYYTFDGLEYYVAETTSPGWLVGDLPYSLKGKMSFHEVVPHPPISFDFSDPTVKFSSPNVVTERYTSYETSVVTRSQDYLAIENSFVWIILLVFVAWFIGYEMGKNDNHFRSSES